MPIICNRAILHILNLMDPSILHFGSVHIISIEKQEFAIFFPSNVWILGCFDEDPYFVIQSESKYNV